MIKVFSVPHTMFAANHLVDQLNRLGYPSKIVGAINTLESCMYIIYNAAALRSFPRNYIVMQTEISTSHWFTPSYYRTLRNARAVWDYSDTNMMAYKSMVKRSCIVTPGINPRPAVNKDINFLFYGWLNGSHRRTRIVEEIKKEIPLTVITNTLLGDMWGILARARVVINVHYFDNSPLELYRIHEALSHSCHVVSEGFDLRYKRFIDFETIPEHIASVAVMKSAIEFKHDLTVLDNMKQIVDGLVLAGM